MKKIKIYIMFGLILALLATIACLRGRSPGLSAEDRAFYHDQFVVNELISSSDHANRKASLHLVSKAWNTLDSGEAIHVLEDALKLDSYNPYAYYYLGQVLSRQGDWQKAGLMARRAEGFFRDDQRWQGKAVVLQAQIHEKLNHPVRAQELYQKAQGLDSRNPLIK